MNRQLRRKQELERLIENNYETKHLFSNATQRIQQYSLEYFQLTGCNYVMVEDWVK